MQRDALIKQFNQYITDHFLGTEVKSILISPKNSEIWISNRPYKNKPDFFKLYGVQIINNDNYEEEALDIGLGLEGVDVIQNMIGKKQSELLLLAKTANQNKDYIVDFRKVYEAHNKPMIDLIGSVNGNAHSLMAAAHGRLKNMGLPEDHEPNRLMHAYAKSYNEGEISTLGILRDFFTIVDSKAMQAFSPGSNEKDFIKMNNTTLHLMCMEHNSLKGSKLIVADYKNQVDQENCYFRTPLFYLKNPNLLFLFDKNEHYFHQDMHGNTPLTFIGFDCLNQVRKTLLPEEIASILQHKNIFGSSLIKHRCIVSAEKDKLDLKKIIDLIDEKVMSHIQIRVPEENTDKNGKTPSYSKDLYHYILNHLDKTATMDKTELILKVGTLFSLNFEEMAQVLSDNKTKNLVNAKTMLEGYIIKESLSDNYLPKAKIKTL